MGGCREISALLFLTPNTPVEKRGFQKRKLKFSEREKRDQPTNRPTKAQGFKYAYLYKLLIISKLYNNKWFVGWLVVVGLLVGCGWF